MPFICLPELKLQLKVSLLQGQTSAWEAPTICTQGFSLFPEKHLWEVRLILTIRLLAAPNSM